MEPHWKLRRPSYSSLKNVPNEGGEGWCHQGFQLFVRLEKPSSRSQSRFRSHLLKKVVKKTFFFRFGRKENFWTDPKKQKCEVGNLTKAEVAWGQFFKAFGRVKNFCGTTLATRSKRLRSRRPMRSQGFDVKVPWYIEFRPLTCKELIRYFSQISGYKPKQIYKPAL